jgi:hypothetical protein
MRSIPRLRRDEGRVLFQMSPCPSKDDSLHDDDIVDEKMVQKGERKLKSTEYLQN